MAKRLQTIVGVGPTTAAALVATVALVNWHLFAYHASTG